VESDELPVNDARQREVIEGIHEDIIDLLIVFIQTYLTVSNLEAWTAAFAYTRYGS